MRKTEIKGYNLSEDYKRLYDLIQEGHRIPAWILYESKLYSKDDSEPIYDLVEVKLSYMSKNWDIGTRGRSFSAWEKSFESFEGVCKDLELRWIEDMSNMLHPIRNKKTVAYEFHNAITGHCYVDYEERQGMTKKEGYEKTPLFKV